MNRLLIAGVAGIMSASIVLAQPATQPAARQIAEIPLDGEIVETATLSPFALGELPDTLRRLVDRIDKARTDQQVSAVVLTVDQPVMGLAQIQELRAAIAAVRAAGKTVHCHVQTESLGGYLVATAADRIALTPTAGVWLMGLHGEALYLKGLLDKLGLAADMLHCGDYKTAPEMFTRTGPSDAAKEQFDWYFDDIYRQMIEAVADGRGMKPDAVQKLIDRGPFTAGDAMTAGLVDELAHRGPFLAALGRPEGVEVATGYGVKKGPQIDFASPFAVFKLLGEMLGAKGEPKGPTIAVVYLDGMIVTGRSERGLFGSSTVGSTKICTTLRKIKDDASVKAAVLRINSPGGSANASDIIYDAVADLAAVKPVVASMGNMAASGGYYAAAAAPMVFAEPGTLTGSIGVWGGKLVWGGLLDKIGVSTYPIRRGANADMFATTTRFTDRQREHLRRIMTSHYGRFKQRVVEGRGDRLNGEIDALAGGRIYTGAQALDRGLIDRLGGLDAAIVEAAQRAGVEDYTVREIPKPKNLIEMMIDSMGLGGEDDASVSLMAEALAPRPVLAAMRSLEPRRARAVADCLQRIELLSSDRVLMLCPLTPVEP